MTIILIIISVAVSYAAFKSPRLMNQLQFNASRIYHQKEYHRLITHAFVHASWEHLIVNMIVLYSFGLAIEMYFKEYFGNKSILYYFLLYFGGILVSNLYAMVKHRNNPYYNAVGASGAISSIVFAAIFFDPWTKILFFYILPIPGIIFAALYLFYSYQMSSKQKDNVAHDAHFLGALYGFIFPIMVSPHLFGAFLDKLFRLI
jgi:membrane associated rhomboid family serine protease